MEAAAVRQALAGLATPDFAAAGSPEGRAWMAALPARLDDLTRQWKLATTGGRLGNGYNAIVLPVSQDGRPLALKLAWPTGRVRDEADALTAWRGQGIVELVAADVPQGALLLERLDATRALAGVPLPEAAAIAGALARTLAIEAAGPLPALQAQARWLAATLPARQRSLHEPVPRQWITLAARLAGRLAEDPARLLVHTDLHYDNILASHRPGQPWVAIDPAPAVGAPERSVAELLWTRADELSGPQAITGLLAAIVENGQLDRAKATAWGFVRSIDYWLWGLENGLTIDPLRCERVASALAPLAERGQRAWALRRAWPAGRGLAAAHPAQGEIPGEVEADHDCAGDADGKRPGLRGLGDHEVDDENPRRYIDQHGRHHCPELEHPGRRLARGDNCALGRAAMGAAHAGTVTRRPFSGPA
jgi:streptomycin 6-kinase